MNVWVVQSTIPWCIHITQHMCKCVLGIHPQSRIARYVCTCNVSRWSHLASWSLFSQLSASAMSKSVHLKINPTESSQTAQTTPPYFFLQRCPALIIQEKAPVFCLAPLLLAPPFCFFSKIIQTVEKPSSGCGGRKRGGTVLHFSDLVPLVPLTKSHFLPGEHQEVLWCPQEEMWKMQKCSEGGVVPYLFGHVSPRSPCDIEFLLFKK